MPVSGEVYNPWRVFVGVFIPNAIVRSIELSSTSKLVFGRLCQYAGENGQSYPAYSTIGHEVGIARRQAIRAVKELERFGLIRAVGRHRADGGISSNIYVFLWHELLNGDRSIPPSDIYDTRGSDISDTSPKCQKSHQEVSGMSLKENQTREKKHKETTIENIHQLLSGTPLSKISEKGLKVLVRRHGSERLLHVADIAAECWRKDRKDIRNPGGYLQSLCESHDVPVWYESPEIRNNKQTAIEAQNILSLKKEHDNKIAEKIFALESKVYWTSLSEIDRNQYCDTVVASSTLGTNFSKETIEAIARSNAWGQHQQMQTISR